MQGNPYVLFPRVCRLNWARAVIYPVGVNWAADGYLKAENQDTDGGDVFGDAVSMSGNTVAISQVWRISISSRMHNRVWV